MFPKRARSSHGQVLVVAVKSAPARRKNPVGRWRGGRGGKKEGQSVWRTVWFPGGALLRPGPGSPTASEPLRVSAAPHNHPPLGRKAARWYFQRRPASGQIFRLRTNFCTTPSSSTEKKQRGSIIGWLVPPSETQSCTFRCIHRRF